MRGLRPVEALRREQEKVPKPTSRTSSPFLRAPVMVSKTLSTARPASPLLRPVVSATAPISSCLFMLPEPLVDRAAWTHGGATCHLKSGGEGESKGKRLLPEGKRRFPKMDFVAAQQRDQWRIDAPAASSGAAASSGTGSAASSSASVQ